MVRSFRLHRTDLPEVRRRDVLYSVSGATDPSRPNDSNP
jgi:hypothetical protein